MKQMDNNFGLKNVCNMKKGILFLFIISNVTTNAQSLKDALYGGKLKTDTGTVIRKSDDLSKKIDTSTKKPADSVKTKMTSAVKDSSFKGMTAHAITDAISVAESKDNKVELKDNNALLKEYMDSLISTLKTEVLPDKKIKNGTYFILVDYEIGLDGQVAINNVTPSPENSFLRDQIKERLNLTVPRMNPVLSNGKPRKVVRKFNFSLNKM